MEHVNIKLTKPINVGKSHLASGLGLR